MANGQTNRAEEPHASRATPQWDEAPESDEGEAPMRFETTCRWCGEPIPLGHHFLFDHTTCTPRLNSDLMKEAKALEARFQARSREITRLRYPLPFQGWGFGPV